MLTVYRRHRTSCEHREEGRKYRRCLCPIWVDGFLDGQEIRKSLNVRDWQKAQDLVRKWEVEDQVTEAQKPEPVTIEGACEKFEVDAKARLLAGATLYKYKLLFRQLKAFANKRGFLFLAELDLDLLSTFRSEWHDGPRSSLKKLERLRAFMQFAQKRGWINNNPASELKAPKVPARPTLPFTREETLRILAALEKHAERAGIPNTHRLRAFVLLLRYSGMRIGDAAQLTAERITGNRLFLYTQKTGQPVHLPLPEFVVKALDACPRSREGHFFWTGLSTVHTATGLWQRSLKRLFKLASISGGHAHRFRDTFAVEFLLSGGTLEQLSVLLGHSSVRITERHYSPWVHDRQVQLEAQLERTWASDPITLAETKGTRRVHEQHRIN